MLHINAHKNSNKVDLQERVDTNFDKRDRKYPYH